MTEDQFVEEYQAVRQHAARIDLDSVGLIGLTGPDAFDLLQDVLARDIEFVTPEQSLSALLLDADGHVVDLVIVHLDDDGYRLETSFGRGPATMAHLTNVCANSGLAVQILDLRATERIILVEGPEAVGVMEKSVDPDLGTLPFGGVTPVTWRDTSLAVSRTGFTGEFGYKIFVPSQHAASLWDSLSDARPCGLGALETAMLEVRQPVLSRELVGAPTALECGYNWLIDITKESFLGRDPVAREFEQGPHVLTIGWVAEAGSQPAPGGAVSIGEAEIGRQVWSTFSPGRKQVLGLARIRPDLAAPGIGITVASADGPPIPARTLAAPYVIPASWLRREGIQTPR